MTRLVTTARLTGAVLRGLANRLNPERRRWPLTADHATPIANRRPRAALSTLTKA